MKLNKTVSEYWREPPPRIVVYILFWPCIEKVKPDSASHQRIIARNARKRKYR